MPDKSELERLMDGEGSEPSSILSDADIAKAKAEARKRVADAMKEAEISRIIAFEMERLKREEGKRTGIADKDELVSLTIDLPSFCDAIRVNGEAFHHGYTYKLPRHVADSFRETMQRAHQHQMVLDGKGLAEQYQRQAPVRLSPAGVEPLAEGVL